MLTYEYPTNLFIDGELIVANIFFSLSTIYIIVVDLKIFNENGFKIFIRTHTNFQILFN